MQFDTILFDLDGTLTDPGLGITNSILYALQKAGMGAPPRRELYQFIGPPLLKEFQRVYGVTPEQAQRLLDDFQVYFQRQGLFENAVYDGIPEMLEKLRSAGRRLILATSKPEPFAVQILEHFGLRRYFDVTAGSSMDETSRATKGQVIAYALERAGSADRRRTVMVGDRLHDVLGARENGLASMGVLYGYGSREELQEAGADWLAETVAAAGELLLG